MSGTSKARDPGSNRRLRCSAWAVIAPGDVSFKGLGCGATAVRLGRTRVKGVQAGALLCACKMAEVHLFLRANVVHLLLLPPACLGVLSVKQGWAPGPVFPGTRRTRMPDPGPRTTRVRQGSPGLPETRVPGWPSTKNALDEAKREKKRKGKEEKERMSE